MFMFEDIGSTLQLELEGLVEDGVKVLHHASVGFPDKLVLHEKPVAIIEVFDTPEIKTDLRQRWILFRVDVAISIFTHGVTSESVLQCYHATDKVLDLLIDNPTLNDNINGTEIIRVRFGPSGERSGKSRENRRLDYVSQFHIRILKKYQR